MAKSLDAQQTARTRSGLCKAEKGDPVGGRVVEQVERDDPAAAEAAEQEAADGPVGRGLNR